MSETIKDWLETLFANEICEARSSANNEHLWALDSETEDEMHAHQKNAETITRYIAVLNKMKGSINQYV